MSSLSIHFSEIRELSHLCKTLSSLLNNPANSLCTSFRLNSLSVAHQNQVAARSVARAPILFCASLKIILPRQLGIIPLFHPAGGSQLPSWWITDLPPSLGSPFVFDGTNKAVPVNNSSHSTGSVQRMGMNGFCGCLLSHTDCRDSWDTQVLLTVNVKLQEPNIIHSGSVSTSIFSVPPQRSAPGFQQKGWLLTLPLCGLALKDV